MIRDFKKDKLLSYIKKRNNLRYLSRNVNVSNNTNKESFDYVSNNITTSVNRNIKNESRTNHPIYNNNNIILNNDVIINNNIVINNIISNKIEISELYGQTSTGIT